MITHMDNFSPYGRNLAVMTNNIYAQAGGGTGASLALVDDPDGVSAGTVMRMQGNGDNSITAWRYASPFGANSVFGMAFRLWLIELPSNNNEKTHFVSIRNNANAEIGSMSVLSTGALRFRIYDAVYDTDVPVVSANGWYHYEVRYENTAANTVSFEVRIEGRTVLSEVALAIPVQDPVQSLVPSQAAGSRNNISGDASCYYKDLVLWDGEGTDNIDFLGSVLVTNLDLASDFSLNWTPSTGATGYTILNNRPPNDAQYIQAGDPPPAPYVGTLTDLPLNVTSVRALMTFIRAAKSDGGDASLQNGLISGASTVLGSDRPITVSPTYWRDFFAEDPATTAPWTPAAVNAAKLQIDRTT